MQKRIFLAMFGLMLLFGIGLISLTPMTVSAIDEVTPTPVPVIPANDIDVPQALEDGFARLQANDTQAAIESFSQVIQAEPDNAEAYMLRSLAYSAIEDYGNAIADLSVAIDLTPQTYHPDRAVIFPLTEWFLYTLRGTLYVEAGDNTLAMADFDAALSLSPSSDNDLTFGARAELNYTLGNTAAGDVDTAIAEAFANMGAGNLAGAMDSLTEAIDSGQRTPSVAIAYYNRAVLNGVQGNEIEAIQDYSDALLIDPNMNVGFLARGITYRQAGDLVAAGKDFYNRMNVLGTDFVDAVAAVGEGIEIQMDYQRVVRVRFEGVAGQTVTISAREVNRDETDPLIVLLDPAGNPIAGDDDFGGYLDAMIEDFELPETGTYILMVSHAEGGYAAGFAGMIRIAIENCSSSGSCF